MVKKHGPRGEVERRESILRFWRDATVFLGAGPTANNASSWRYFLLHGAVFSIASGLAVAALEPSSTMELSYVGAALAWMLQIGAALALLTASVTGLVVAGVQRRVAVTIAIAVLPVLVAPISLLVDGGLGGEPDSSPDQLGTAMLREVVEVAPACLALSALLFLLLERASRLSQLMRRRIVASQATHPKLSDILPQVPLSIGSDLIRAEAQDHYTLVVTTEGSTTLSVGFAETVEKLEPFEGVQCHRSHWVVPRHVTRLVRDGSAHRCVLSNGESIPVSRRRAAKVRLRL